MGDGVAPAGTIPNEIPLDDGANSVSLGADRVYRLEAEAGEHVAFVLTFPKPTPDVVLTVQRWDGTRPVTIGATDGGAGQRFLSVLDAESRRTYWIRIQAGASADATLEVTRTGFDEGAHCPADCDQLVQMPLPNDPAADGYAVDGGTVFRYWFGRRDLVMLVRYAGRQRARAGKTPFYPYDFSQWDGLTPGVDVGSPRHASHQRGKDVDLSIYGEDGRAPWRSYCDLQPVSGGRECKAGTRHGFDSYETARQIAATYESGRVTMCFLDRELIAAVKPGAAAAASDGLIDADLVPLFADGRHLQHWPNHDNHVHVRVSENAYNAKVWFDEQFEAP